MKKSTDTTDHDLLMDHAIIPAANEAITDAGLNPLKFILNEVSYLEFFVRGIKDVEPGEEWLREKGFYNVRLRVHDKIARIEVDQESMESLLSIREDVLQELSRYGYDYITLDLMGFRSGSMDIHLK